MLLPTLRRVVLATCALLPALALDPGAVALAQGPVASAPDADLAAAHARRQARHERALRILQNASPQMLARLAAPAPYGGGLGAQNPLGITVSSVVTSQMRNAWIMSLAIPADGDEFLAPGYGGTDLLLRIHVPATGADEFFSLFVPDTAPLVERPLLVGFHGAEVSHLDLYISTTFFQECEQRDWFMVAPWQVSTVGSSQSHYGSVQSQVHVETVLDWVTGRYSIDQQRIYGVGFSMGGGAALSYAARYRDLRRPALAAVVNHTGYSSLRHLYLRAGAATQAQLELLYGGPPSDPIAEFGYQRCSLIDVDNANVTIPGGRHMANNLQGVPVYSVIGNSDPVVYLVGQTLLFDDYLGTLPLATRELHSVASPSTCFQNGFNGHCWDTLDETVACDWLSGFTLRQPFRGSLLIDRNGHWDTIGVEQRTAQSFSRLDYLFEGSLNRVILFGRENLQRLEVDPEGASLDTSAPLDVATAAVDGNGVTIVLSGYTSSPSSVTRGGNPVLSSCLPSPLFPTWCYDATTRTVRLNEPAPDLQVWTIQP